MKKILIVVSMIICANLFAAQNLDNKIHNIFPNKEVRSLIFGHYNLDKELAVISKMRGVGDDVLLKAEKDAIKGMKTAIKNYSYEILSQNLSALLISGPGFDNSKMREFSEEISKRLIEDVVKKGVWHTSKDETVVLYTISREYVKTEANNLFDERLNAVIKKLNDYRDTFDTIK